MKILALESSTTSAKAMLYDTSGRDAGGDPIRVITEPYDRSRWQSDPAAEAEDVYMQVMDVGRRLLECEGIGDIDMISLVGAWHSLLLCDTDMQPVTPVYKWDFTGAGQYCGRLREDRDFVDRYYHRSGCMVSGIYPFFKIGWLREQGCDLSRHYIMSQGAYINYRMTGQRITTRCLASGDGLLNIHTGEYNWDMLNEYGAPGDAYCRLVDSEETFALQDEAAGLLGVSEGTPVLPADSDGGANQIGVGASADGTMTFSVGTSGALRITSAEPFIPDRPATWCYMSPKSWLVGAATNGCCNCVDMARIDLFGDATGYGEIEQMISARMEAAGSRVMPDTPVFLPFTFGERCPGWDDSRRGGYFDMKPEHEPIDRYIAVQEGVLFNLYQCYEVLSEICGTPRQILLSGGILHSAYWSQMCADIFGMDMCVNGVDQGSLLGGVAMALEATGELQRAEDFAPDVTAVIRPDEIRHERYMQKYGSYLRYYESEH